jgi:hypothetical protein
VSALRKRLFGVVVFGALVAVVGVVGSGLASATAVEQGDGSCTAGQQQYEGCGPTCDVVFNHPRHQDMVGVDMTPVWETESMSVRVDCPSGRPVETTVTWLRGATEVGHELSYTVVAADVGFILSVRVENRDATGVQVVTRALGATADYHAPVQTSAPTIQGMVKVGETLSATTGDWHLVGSAPGPIVYEYFWFRGSVPIVPGRLCQWEAGSGPRDDATYTLTSADVGSVISLAVLASNSPGGPPAAFISMADCGIAVESAVVTP